MRPCLTVTAWALSASFVVACQVPVFRYALERWEPDAYRLLVVAEEGTVAEADLAALSENARVAGANLEVMGVNGRRDDSAAGGRLWLGPQDRPVPAAVAQWLVEEFPDGLGELPQMLLVGPPLSGPPRVIWRSAWDPQAAQQVWTSPLRETLIQRVLAGDSAVWILVNSGHRQRDADARDRLEEHLERMHQVVQLPPHETIVADEQFNPHNTIPLHVAFSLLEVDRDDPAEQVLLGMLLRGEGRMLPDDEPVAVAVFGRGRTFPARVGDQIAAEQIEDDCQYLCGPCSCEIKRENPGTDLLLATHWPTDFGAANRQRVPLPTLTGLGAFEALASADGPLASADGPLASADGPLASADGPVETGDRMLSAEQTPGRTSASPELAGSATISPTSTAAGRAVPHMADTAPAAETLTATLEPPKLERTLLWAMLTVLAVSIAVLASVTFVWRWRGR